jgi:hypothetical protein
VKHIGIARSAGLFATVAFVGAALVMPAATLATQPSPDHKVTICHRTADQANPFIAINVDIASTGHLLGGHDTEHQGDIIPAYAYRDFSFAGLNWDAAGQAILAAGCTVPTETAAPTEPAQTETPSQPTDDATPSQPTDDATPSQPTDDATPSQPTDGATPSQPAPDADASQPVETPASTDTAQGGQPSQPVASTGPVGDVLGATGAPEVTLPPTDAITAPAGGAGNGWTIVLLALSGLLGGLLILTPAASRSRR